MDKPLTAETERIVANLRRVKAAFETLFGVDNGKPSVTYNIGEAISRLCWLDVNSTRVATRTNVLDDALKEWVDARAELDKSLSDNINITHARLRVAAAELVLRSITSKDRS